MSTLIRSASFVPDVKWAGVDCVRVKGKTTTYEAYDTGSDKKAVLELELPWATQTMADNLFAKYKGFQYQGYEATDAILNNDFLTSKGPINTPVSMYGVYSAVYSIHIKGGIMFVADISAPSNNL